MSEYKRLTVRTPKGLKLKRGRKYVELFSDKSLTLNALNYLAELEDKRESGTLKDTIVKVGDTIYYATYIEKKINGVDGIRVIEPWEVEKIDIYKDFIIYRLTHNGTDDYNTARDSEFGKNWFLTESEAESRLKELLEGKK